MAVLVTGGAGYIGSVTVEELRKRGEKVVVLDNLVYGHREAVFEDTPFYEGNIGDQGLVARIIDEHEITAAVHFAAFAYVGESVHRPSLYYSNNVTQGISFLDALIAGGVKQIVFSSTCATYGEPVELPISETHPQNPTNPYGASKLFMERIMRDYDRAYGLKYAALRYFNAAGATENRGEDHEPETHLIPLVLKSALGERDSISIFGDDYETKDGTCVRDYIHVTDLASAHLAALDYLGRGGESTAINLGNGLGYSVLEVVDAARKVTDREIKVKFESRREGDPSHLVADSTKARNVLGWKPRYPGLEDIIGSAWKWHLRNPAGYEPAEKTLSQS